MKESQCPTCKGRGIIEITEERDYYAYIGAKVQARRKEFGFTQDDLANKIGLLRTSVANLEAGKQRMNLMALDKICEVLELDFKDLMP